MSDFSESSDLDIDQVDEIAHWFELDISALVATNHQLVIDAIANLEAQEIAQTKEMLGDQEWEVVDSTVRFQESFYRSLRRAAHHLALVGLVTRFQHWIDQLAIQSAIRSSRNGDSKVIDQLVALNASLGAGPVPIPFFADSVTARDSIVQADSKAQWQHHGKLRTVADRYRNGSDLELTDDELKEAIAKAIQQVKWYDARVASLLRR